MAELCAELEMRVIAEGVEAEAERDALLGCGCGLLQGTLFGAPSPEPARVAWPEHRRPGRRPPPRTIGSKRKGSSLPPG